MDKKRKTVDECEGFAKYMCSCTKYCGDYMDPEPANFGDNSVATINKIFNLARRISGTPDCVFLNITQFTVPQRNTFTQKDLDFFYENLPDSFRKKTMDFRHIDTFVDIEIENARFRIAKIINAKIKHINTWQMYKQFGAVPYEPVKQKMDRYDKFMREKESGLLDYFYKP